MTEERWEKARQLSMRPYATYIVRIEEQEDDSIYYMAMTPELPGCRSDGDTPEEARENLADARLTYIYYALEDGLPVPDPVFYSQEEVGGASPEGSVVPSNQGGMSVPSSVQALDLEEAIPA